MMWGNPFSQLNVDSITLHVPKESVTLYKNEFPWKDLYDVVPLEDYETSIPDVKQFVEKKGKEGVVYDLSGRKLPSLQGGAGGRLHKGVYIQGGKKFVVK